MDDKTNTLLGDNTLSKDELLDKVVIKKTEDNDIDKVCEIITNTFNLPSVTVAHEQMQTAKVLINESVKLVNKENDDIYGILMFCEYPLSIGTPLKMLEKNLCDYLEKYRHVNGHSFIIDKRLRNTNIDKEMLHFNLEYLRHNYDLIWCGVDASLKSQNYWKKLGFVELIDIPQASFFLLPLSENMLKEYL